MAASPKRRSVIVVGVTAVLIIAAVVVAVSMRKQRTSPVPDGGYFTTSAPGAPLPSDATCAQRVHRAPWEPRSDNDTQNHAKPNGPVHLAASNAFDPTWNAKYEPRITGDFTGLSTTGAYTFLVTANGPAVCPFQQSRKAQPSCPRVCARAWLNYS